MILIYAHTATKRLQYICKFIFKEQLGINYTLTIDAEGFKNHNGPKINYSSNNKEDSTFTIPNNNLLFETDIKKQDIICFTVNGFKAFFKTENGDFAFDLFSACFYLLSRYEEYLPHQTDTYNRYAHYNSLAFKEDFLNIPLVNIWMHDFAKALKEKFPALVFQHPKFIFKPTYDIDIAWSYKHKGLLRNLGGFIKHPSTERLGVMAGLKKDPFNSYEFMHSLHKGTNLEPVYFFLAAIKKGKYDKNISPNSKAMWQLIRRHVKQYDIGLHPSWKSNDDITILKKEKKTLEAIANVGILRSRQHYIKFTLPDTMENLTAVGIENDYSMGYGSVNGFRASVASSFQWFNLKKNSISRLQIHPFCFMDANSKFEQKLNAEQAYGELLHYYEQCKKVNGTLITIFHNNFLGSAKEFNGWKDMYARFISQLPQ